LPCRSLLEQIRDERRALDAGAIKDRYFEVDRDDGFKQFWRFLHHCKIGSYSYRTNVRNRSYVFA